MRVEVERVSFHYGSAKVLNSMTLTVQEGDLLGVIGPNGAGKTTLLRCLTGVLKPSGGTVLIDGREVGTFTRKELARRMGALPQEPASDFDYTVEEVVSMGRLPWVGFLGRIGKVDVDAVEEALRITGLQVLRPRPISTLSGGERRRTFLARALAQTPRFLILDEPTVHLDISHQYEIMDTIKRLSQRMVVVCSLHDLSLASQYCTALVLMKDGRIIRAGTPEHVLEPEALTEAYGIHLDVSRIGIDGFLVVPRRSDRPLLPQGLSQPGNL